MRVPFRSASLLRIGFVLALLGTSSVGMTSAQAQDVTTAAMPRPATIDGCDVSPPTGRVLVQPVVPSGAAQPGLVVVDPTTGGETGRIDVPPVTALFPTALPDRALAIAGDDLFLIDAADLTATWIELDEPASDLSPNPVQFRGTAGTRYVLLGTPSFDLAVLVDVQSGSATNLTALVVPPVPDAQVFLPFAAVTPNDAQVVMWDGRHVYVVNTANPEGARQIDTAAFAFAPDFSPDGRELIYSRSEGPGTGSNLVLASVDGSASGVIRSSEQALVTLWAPRSRTLLVDERTETGAAAGSVYVLDIDSGDETALFEYDGSLTTVQFDPGGTRALLGVEQRGVATWTLADLSTGDLDALPQLDGSRVLPGLYADQRWALAIPPAASDDPISGPVFRSVDLDTGAVGRLFEQPNGVAFDLAPQLSPDGRLALVTGETNRGETLWLLDAADLTATRILGGLSVAGVFAPGGCQVAVRVETSIDGIPGTVSSILPLNGEPAREIGNGAVVGWTVGGVVPHRDPSEGPVGFSPAV